MNILADYEIICELGEGTFGVVKLGKVKATGEKVAIKILEKKKIIYKEDKIRVEREIDILQKVHHINVIEIKKILEEKDNIYIIMEYCSKGELFNHIIRKQCLQEKEAAYFYYQLINGLESIHYNGLTHRDLKPENLLLTNDYILKIIDFGLGNYYSKLKFLNTPCGSPCYASPEMVIGKQYDGFLTDVWSTGIVLYAMLTGYLPFEDPDNETLFKKIYRCDVEYPDDINGDSLDLMKKILVNNPDERITLSKIKKHPFYLKGKKEFEFLHPELVKEVEKKCSNNKGDIEVRRLSKDNKNERKKVIKEFKIKFEIKKLLKLVSNEKEIKNDEEQNSSSRRNNTFNKYNYRKSNEEKDSNVKEKSIKDEIIKKKAEKGQNDINEIKKEIREKIMNLKLRKKNTPKMLKNILT